MNMPNTAALTIEDRISDPMMPELDPSLLDFRPIDIDFSAKQDDPLNWNSQILSDPISIEIGRHAPVRNQHAEFDEEVMNIDLDLDLGLDDGPSMELGRKAPPSRTSEDIHIGGNDKFADDNVHQDRTRLSSRVPSLIADDGGREPDNDGMLIHEDHGFNFPIDDDATVLHAAADPRLQRDSQSPLSSVRSSMARELDVTNRNIEEEASSMRQATHKAKKRKVLQADSDTMLSSTQIKQQQADRSAILKPASFLSRDPTVFSLLSMQKNGGFVSGIMGDARAKGWAPELRGILSIEMVRQSGELKRKRGSSIANVSGNEPNADVGDTLRLEIPDDETLKALGQGGPARTDAAVHDVSEVYLPADDGILLANNDIGGSASEDDEEESSHARERFDETTAPLLHPSEQGAISQGTKHAVHLLRDRFGSSTGSSPAHQKIAQMLFQDLLPERMTSKADVTKMFFEVLVLATKDAVKIEQADNEIGSAIRIRAKRGLWGAWAEREAGGEIEEQNGIAPAVAAGF